MKELKTIIKQELREDENIFILKKEEVNSAMGIMHEYTLDEIFNVYSGKEKVVRYWHEDGLCIIIK